MKNKTEKRERKYLPTFAEKIDRLSICQLKEWLIPEHREEYAKEIADIEHDLNLDIDESDVDIRMNAKTIRAIIVLAQINREIWLSESNARQGKKDGNDLLKSHSLNSIRNLAKNKIQDCFSNGRKDYKIDVLTDEYINWSPSWDDEKQTKIKPCVHLHIDMTGKCFDCGVEGCDE